MEKKLFKYFFLFFLLLFLAINWGNVSWIFNYKAVSLFFSNFFKKPQPQPISEEIKPTKEEEIKTEDFEFSEKENSLEIPRIEISAPVFLVESVNEKKILEALDRGVVMFSDYSLPGEPGQTIIIGHSAQHDWPKSNPTWVFTYLRDVKEGDEIILHFNHRKYRYLVNKKFILKEGEELPPSPAEENFLFLITCWPPGRLVFKQKLVVQAHLVKNR